MKRNALLPLIIILVSIIFARHFVPRWGLNVPTEGQVFGAMPDKDWQKEQESILKDYASVSYTVRADVIRRAAQADHPGKVNVLINTMLPKELKSNEFPLVDLIVQSLGNMTDPACIDEIITATRKSVLPERILLLRAAGKIKTPETIKMLIDILKAEKNRDNLSEIAAIDALSESTPSEALSPVLEALNHSAWEVRVSAVYYLAKVSDEEGRTKALSALRAKLPQENGRLKNDISDALNSLRQVRPKGGLTVPTEGKDQPISDSQSAATTTFFDVPLVGDVLFVVDMSRSMDEKNANGVSKWQKLVEELKSTIEQMSKLNNVKFNIIAFSDRFVTFDKTLISAADNKDKAFKWIDKQAPNGSTDTYGAMLMALAAQGTDEQKQKLIYTSGVPSAYSICLMSDGEPTTGKYIRGDEILGALRVINQVKKIKINTIALNLSEHSGHRGGGGGGRGGWGGPPGGGGGGRGRRGGSGMSGIDLLEQIAKENNGVYKSVKLD